MFHVNKIEKNIGNGSTEPKIAHLSNGEDKLLAVIKTRDNVEGFLTLINEYICYRLACSLELLMPESGIAIIDENTTKSGEIILSEDDLGSCFYSTFLEKATVLNEAIISNINNKGAFEQIILFDHIIYNKDRNKGNLLITIGKNSKELYTIDHTHVFKNEALWDRYCLKQGIDEKDYLDENILVSNEYTYGLFFRNTTITRESLKVVSEKFQDIITKELLDEIINDLPKDWSVNETDLIILKEYLMYRLSHIEEICDLIINFKERG